MGSVTAPAAPGKHLRLLHCPGTWQRLQQGFCSAAFEQWSFASPPGLSLQSCCCLLPWLPEAALRWEVSLGLSLDGGSNQATVLWLRLPSHQQETCLAPVQSSLPGGTAGLAASITSPRGELQKQGGAEGRGRRNSPAVIVPHGSRHWQTVEERPLCLEGLCSRALPLPAAACHGSCSFLCPLKAAQEVQTCVGREWEPRVKSWNGLRFETITSTTALHSPQSPF